MEQLPDRHHGVELAHRLVAMDREVAEFLDDPRLGEHRIPRRRLERRLMQQGAEMVLVGELEGRVAAVEPVHRQFQSPSRVETGGPRVAVGRSLRLGRRFVQSGPFSSEEGEVSHPESASLDCNQEIPDEHNICTDRAAEGHPPWNPGETGSDVGC